MDNFNLLGFAAFLGITVLFFLIRSRPILFHLTSALLIGSFVHWTGRHLSGGNVAEWLLLICGLLLYWFGLVIVRVMLTRSVSLRMLSGYDRREQTVTAGEGIFARLSDARHFGLMVSEEKEYRLTLFGRFIAGIVAMSYAILRIK
jgi:hypothetical protein